MSKTTITIDFRKALPLMLASFVTLIILWLTGVAIDKQRMRRYYIDYAYHTYMDSCDFSLKMSEKAINESNYVDAQRWMNSYTFYLHKRDSVFKIQIKER